MSKISIIRNEDQGERFSQGSDLVPWRRMPGVHRPWYLGIRLSGMFLITVETEN